MGDLREALGCYEQALVLYREVPGNECGQANCLYNSGVALGGLGDSRGASECYERALILFQGVPDNECAQAECLFNRGAMLNELGDWWGALGCFERSLTLFQGVPGSECEQADCLYGSGVSLSELGDCWGALGYFDRALVLLDKGIVEADWAEAERTGARCLQGIGDCLVELNEAVFPDHFARALEVFQRPEHVDHTKADQASCLRSIGNGSLRPAI